MNIFNRSWTTEEIKKELATHTIFDKIEFSKITKEAIKAKLKDLVERQVPERKVLLKLLDEEVVFYWFKNWLHPDLKHWVPLTCKDKRGCSRRVLEKDYAQDSLRFYENGQQNFEYTLEDIYEYINE